MTKTKVHVPHARIRKETFSHPHILSEQKDAITGRVIHRIQNHLSACIVNINLISQDKLDPENTIKALSHIRSAYKGLMNLCRKKEILLSIWREPLNLKPLCIEEIIYAQLAELESGLTQKSLSIAWQPKSQTMISGDSARFHLLFSCLLQNMIQFSSLNTELNISMHQTHSETNIQLENICPPQNNLIPEEIFENAINKIGTNGKVYLGFGLLTAHHIIQKHGGTIQAQGKKESVFSISISIPNAAIEEDPPNE
ncbi:MAG: GHKL domain-containing protein [Candidatus Margulisbacteria bacterium]|nr:GHKL domain-containing protein [Candidatus Margulisiibacteriota bacterium]